MALYHFSLGHIGRTAGHTAIAAAAYRSGEKLYDAYYGETQDYSRKTGVITSMISAIAVTRFLLTRFARAFPNAKLYAPVKEAK